MTDQSFTPPTYKDTTHVLFNRRTGVIVATEQRWTLEQNNTGSQMADPSHLFKAANFPALKKEDLDVVILDSADTLKGQMKYIDVKLKKPVFEERHLPESKGINPQHIEAP